VLCRTVVEKRRVVAHAKEGGDVEAETAKGGRPDRCPQSTDLEVVIGIKCPDGLKKIERERPGGTRWIDGVGHNLRASKGHARIARRATGRRVGKKGRVIGVDDLALRPLRAAMARLAVRIEDCLPR